MARSITSGFQTEIEAQSLMPCLLAKAQFDSGDVRVWSGYGDIDFNSETYSGVGNFLGINQVEETQTLEAKSTAFTLSGIPSSYVSLALNESFQGRAISCWFGVLDSTKQLVADPFKIFSGQMDTMQIMDDGTNSSITINAESDLIDLRKANVRNYTPEDQKIDYSSDKGLDYVPLIQDLAISWGGNGQQ